MSQAPAMPLYTDALLGDTLHLSTEEFGAYCLILFATWRNNGRPLPDDDRALARICRVHILKWRKTIRPRLVEFFDLSGQTWRQKRLETEWGRVEKLIEVARANGLKGGRPRNPAGNPDESYPNPNPLFNNSYSLDSGTPRAHTHARDGSPAEAPWEIRCNFWANGHRWNPVHGPAPDEPGCLAPPDLAAAAVRKRQANGSHKETDNGR